MWTANAQDKWRIKECLDLQSAGSVCLARKIAIRHHVNERNVRTKTRSYTVSSGLYKHIKARNRIITVDLEQA